MQNDRYAITVFGRPTREPGNKWAFTYYLPNRIPRNLEFSSNVVAELSEADAALGQLQGLGAVVADPGLLLGPYIRREALASTRIEGTQASLSDVLQSEIEGRPHNENTAEVLRYLDATNLAFDLVERLPITQIGRAHV